MNVLEERFDAVESFIEEVLRKDNHLCRSSFCQMKISNDALRIPIYGLTTCTRHHQRQFKKAFPLGNFTRDDTDESIFWICLKRG